jgi:TRAP-type C4-dicarboxylate transport system substrate-binding protein
MIERRKIRWLMAHFPLYLFQRTAEAFGQELEKELPGKFEIELHTFESYAKKYSKQQELLFRRNTVNKIETSLDAESKKNVVAEDQLGKKWKALFDNLGNGDLEITQTQVHIVGVYLDRTFEALDLPFLFDNHEHVANVLDGEIGDQLCHNLSTHSSVRGLGFTYSGGNRIIGSNKSITNLNELAESNFLAGSYVGKQMFKDLGVKSVEYGIPDESNGDTAIDSMETTYIRFSGKNVLKTNHSIFMTTILTGNKFFDSLSAQEQDIFKKIAKRVAVLERQWSIEDAEQYERNAVANGVKIVELNQADQEKLKKIAKNSYRYIKDLNVGTKLVKNIINQSKH